MKFADTDLGERLQLLAAPLPSDEIQWRQDGKPGARQNKFFARFVAYVDAQFVQSRLDAVFLGEWTLHHELLPERGDEDGVAEVAMKAVLTIAGITREGVGTGRDYKAAASDSFKRAAVRFGVAAELYDYDVNWVQVDSDSKFAKPVEDPGLAYARKQRKTGEPPRRQAPPLVDRPSVREQVASAFDEGRAQAQRDADDEDPYGSPTTSMLTRPVAAPPATAPPFVPKAATCPICGSAMWDNRLTKTGKQPDFKCKTKSCDGAVWLPSEKKKTAMPVSAPADANDFPDALRDEQDNLPF